MNVHNSLMPRAERHKREKQKSVVYYILIEQGLIIFLPFVILPINEVIAIILLIISVLTLPFVTKSKVALLFSNLTLLVWILIFLYSVNLKNMNSDLNILLILFIILVAMLIFWVQAFVIVIKMYSLESEKYPNVDKEKWYFKLTVKIIYCINLTMDKLSLLLPLIYYAFITCLIIYIYAILYNGLNYFYELRDNEQAGYYMSSELIMNDADELGDNIYLNFGYSLEQNTSTRIPIVDIRYSKNIQSSAHYTSKQKQDIALQEFGQNTLKISLSEYMYFSTTTFFTVGYGDVQLKGRVPKLLAQSEMFVAGFFNIIFVPLILYVITEYISKRRNRDKNEVHNRK